MLAPWKKSYDQPRQHIKKQRHYFANKGSSDQGYGFSCGHVWLWELDCEESWALKNWCWEGLRAGGEGDDRGRDGWMASLTQWAWVWAGSRSWWWTEKPGMLQSMGSQIARHDWVTELNCSVVGSIKVSTGKTLILVHVTNINAHVNLYHYWETIPVNDDRCTEVKRCRNVYCGFNNRTGWTNVSPFWISINP